MRLVEIIRLCGFSSLLWMAGLPSIQAEVLDVPGNGDSVIGQSYTITTHYGETTPQLADWHYTGFHEILWANPHMHSWMPGEGTTVRIPRRYILPGETREGLVLNIAELRLYYYEKTKNNVLQVRTYPVSIGRMDWVTPLGRTVVVDRLENPNWYPPESVLREHWAAGEELSRVVAPGPDNPLGRYALMLGMPGYFIHGTNRNYGIGMRVTHGCIRLRSRDIGELIYRVPVGTSVEIISMPIKFGLLGGMVYMEAHAKPLLEFPMPEKQPVLDEAEMTAPMAALEQQLPLGDYVIFWDQLMEVARQRTGEPVVIGWNQIYGPAPTDQPELAWTVARESPE